MKLQDQYHQVKTGLSELQVIVQIMCKNHV